MTSNQASRPVDSDTNEKPPQIQYAVKQSWLFPLEPGLRSSCAEFPLKPVEPQNFQSFFRYSKPYPSPGRLTFTHKSLPLLVVCFA